jgi:hypothetical protein
MMGRRLSMAGLNVAQNAPGLRQEARRREDKGGSDTPPLSGHPRCDDVSDRR